MDYLNSLDARRLREVLDYDASTGAFRWKIVKVKNQCKVGDIAGSMSQKGYRLIGVDGQYYMAHRLAWLYVHGEWPKDQIDHFNEIKSDNRLANLRQATGFENQQNITPARRSCRSNVRGAYAQKNRWQSEIRVAGKRIYLGSFSTVELAHEAYLQAKALYHPFSVPVPVPTT